MTEYIKKNILLALVLLSFVRCLFFEKSYLELILFGIVTLLYSYFEYKFNDIKLQALEQKLNKQIEDLDKINKQFNNSVNEIKEFHLNEIKLIKDQLSAVRTLHNMKQGNSIFK